MDSFRFYTAISLLLLPIVIGLLAFRLRSRHTATAVFSSIAAFKSLPVTLMQRIRRTLPWCYGLGLVLLTIALARPQAGKSESRMTGEGIAIEIVLDVSGSMEALDFELDGQNVNRLEAVKHVITNFVLGSEDGKLAGRKDDLIGVVAFGGFADSKCPLTLDHGALVDIIDSLQIPKPVRDGQGRILNAESMQEELATAIGDGVALSLRKMNSAEPCWCRLAFALMKNCCVRSPKRLAESISMLRIPKVSRRSTVRLIDLKRAALRNQNTRSTQSCFAGSLAPAWL